MPPNERCADLPSGKKEVMVVCGEASERGADRAAIMATLIMTAKLNDIDPRAWLADVVARINDHAVHRLDRTLAVELEAVDHGAP